MNKKQIYDLERQGFERKRVRLENDLQNAIETAKRSDSDELQRIKAWFDKMKDTNFDEPIEIEGLPLSLQIAWVNFSETSFAVNSDTVKKLFLVKFIQAFRSESA